MKNFVLKLTFCIVILVLSGCVYGPDVEHKSVLNTLNGENYDTSKNMSSDAMFVPFAKTKERMTEIKGQLVIHEDDSLPTPLRYISLAISNDKGDIIQKLKSGPNGEFAFSGVFLNGSYAIKVESDKYVGQLLIDVNAYSVDKLILIAKKK
jgi:hypothetical protein